MNRNIIASIIFAVGSFLIFILILPQYDLIQNSTVALKGRQALIADRIIEAKNFKDFNEQVKGREADINKITVLLPTKKQLDQVVSSIDTISKESGMQLVSLTTGDATTETSSNFKKVFIGLDMTGKYPAFIDFLKSLEQNLRIYDVAENSAAVSTAGGANSGLVNFSVKMNTYYLK